MSDITAERLWRACRRGRCSVAAKLIHWLGPKHMQSLQELACGLQLCYLPTIHISTFVNKVLLVHSLRPPPPLAHTAAPSFNPCCRSAPPAPTAPAPWSWPAWARAAGPRQGRQGLALWQRLPARA